MDIKNLTEEDIHKIRVEAPELFKKEYDLWRKEREITNRKLNLDTKNLIELQKIIDNNTYIQKQSKLNK